VINERDIWRIADLLIRHHGGDASFVAARRFQELLKAGDAQGCADWRRIVIAVGQLFRTKPAEDERVN